MRTSTSSIGSANRTGLAVLSWTTLLLWWRGIFQPLDFIGPGRLHEFVERFVPMCEIAVFRLDLLRPDDVLAAGNDHGRSALCARVGVTALGIAAGNPLHVRDHLMMLQAALHEVWAPLRWLHFSSESFLSEHSSENDGTSEGVPFSKNRNHVGRHHVRAE